MNLPCDVVMDLVGLYKDRLASEQSAKAIEEHLKTCPSCSKYYKMYDSIEKKVSKVEPQMPNISFGDDRKYLKISHRLRKNRQRTMAIIAAVAGVSATLTAVNIIKLFSNNNN